MKKKRNEWLQKVFDTRNYCHCLFDKAFNGGQTCKIDFFDRLKDRFKYAEVPYGLANENDFGEYVNVISKIFAYDNKHYYIYRAISDSNKFGYLSRKQYYKLQLSLKKNKDLVSPNEFVKNFCRDYGTMASPAKLMKRAVIDNPAIKFFQQKFKVLDAHEGRLGNENILTEFAQILSASTMPLKLIFTDIQDCYDIELPDGYERSDKRFCTHSCMEHSQVGTFYDSFPVKGVSVWNNGQAVGRFLLWDLPDGKQYVDRLYVRAAYAKTALATIDKKFPEAIKYPALTDKGEFDGDIYKQAIYIIKIKDINKFITSDRYPWIDTFAHLKRNQKTGEYVLSNSRCNRYVDDDGNVYVNIETFRGFQPRNVHLCPHCGKLLIDDVDKQNFGLLHNLRYCDNYNPTGRKEKIIVDIVKRYLKSAEEKEYGKRTGKDELSLFGL